MNVLKAILIVLLLCFHVTYSQIDSTGAKNVNDSTKKFTQAGKSSKEKPAARPHKVKLLITRASEVSSIKNLKNGWFSALTEAYFNFQLQNLDSFEIIPRKEFSDLIKQRDDFGITIPESDIYQAANKVKATHVLIHFYSVDKKIFKKIKYYLEIIDLKNKTSVISFDKRFPIGNLNTHLQNCTEQILDKFHISLSDMDKKNLKQQVFSLHPATNKLLGEILVDIKSQDSSKTAQQMIELVQNDPGFGLAVFKTAEMYEALKKYAKASSLYNQLFIRNAFYYHRLFLRVASYNRINKLYDQALRIITLAENRGFKTPEIYLEKAAVFLKMQKLSEAQKYYEKILKIDPNQQDAILYLAKIKRKTGLYNESLQMLGKINQASPNIVLVNLEKGENYLALGQDKQALDILQSVYRLLPGDPGLNKLLGDIYFKSKNYQTASSHYKTAIEKTPEDLNLLLKTSNTYKKAKQFQKALDVLNKYKSNFKNSKLVNREIGLLLFHVKKTAEARAILETCLDIEPPDTNVFIILGDIYSSAGEKDRAIAMYEKAESLVKNKIKIKLSLANLYFLKKEYQKAENRLRSIISVNSEIAGVNRSLADILYLKGLRAEALNFYKKEIDLHGNNFHIQQRIALINFEANDFEQAQKETEKLIQLDQSNVAGYFQLSLLALKQKRDSDAKLFYEKADATGKLTKDNYLTLADGFTSINSFDEAIDAYNKSLKFDPSNEKALIELGKIYTETKKNSLLAQTYEKIYEIDGNKNNRYLEEAGHIYFKLGNNS
ncbi:MAG: tetratricopeptide repeat protein, partial [Chitinispirillia bacterium]